MGKMAEMQRKLLEQMMGPEAMGIKQQNYDWWDDKVCRNFLFGTCPHLVFGNTKMDIGPCPKVHSDRILKQFQEAQATSPGDPRISAFKQEHENNLYGFVDDCDRRIKMSQRKLEKTPEENRKTVDLMKEIGEIELSIQGGTEEIEALGEAGKVEESMDKLAAVEALKQLKGDKEKELQNLNETAGASGHQKLRVCETCGAMLSVLDSDKRLADHFGGKLHLGYHELRKLLSQFADERMAARQGGGAPPPQAAHGQNGGMPPSAAPSGPRGGGGGAPPPSGPSFAPAPGPGAPPPQTPLHSRVPPADEMPAVGHGDKVKREAGELVEDVKVEKDREERHGSSGGGDRDRDRYSEESRRHRHRDEDGERYERSSRHDDRDQRDRSERSDRDRDRERERDRGDRDSHRERDRGDRDRDRKYDDDRRRDRDRSRSPAKRRVL